MSRVGNLRPPQANKHKPSLLRPLAKQSSIARYAASGQVVVHHFALQMGKDYDLKIIYIFKNVILAEQGERGQETRLKPTLTKRCVIA